MGNEKKWSIGQDAKKGDILVLELDDSKWIFRFERTAEYPNHYVHSGILVKTTDATPMLSVADRGVSFINDKEKVRPAHDGEKELFFQSFGETQQENADIQRLEEFRDWLKEKESYVNGLKTAREKLERMFNL